MSPATGNAALFDALYVSYSMQTACDVYILTLRNRYTGEYFNLAGAGKLPSS